MKRQLNKSVIKIIVAALAVFLVLLIVALIVNLAKLGAANSRKSELAEKAAKLDGIIAENGTLIDYCSSPEFIENYAREYLDMIYRGEIIIGIK